MTDWEDVQQLRDPVAFSQRILGHKTWPVQEAILRSIFQNRYTAVKGCHASSKTFSVAEAALCWLAIYQDGVVVTTGPSDRQIRVSVWKEIHQALETSKLDYGVTPTLKEMHLSPKNYAIGFTTRADPGGGPATKMHSIHGGHVLLVVDEAPGVPAAVWESLAGLRAGGIVHTVALGNPLVPSGRFYEIFTTESERWNCITVDAYDTPNLKDVETHRYGCVHSSETERRCDDCKERHGCRSCGRPRIEHLREMPLDEGGPLDQNPVPYLIDRRYVRDGLDMWGEQNPQYEARVRGVFPQQAEGALIPLQWLEDAQWREHVESNQRYTAGIDVAEAGEDETVCYIVDRGHVVCPPVCSMAPDARGDVVRGLEPYRRQLGQVRYDALGVGAFFGPHLRDLGFEVRPVKVSWTARKPKMFERLRDELYWDLRSLFESGSIAALEDETTRAQLAGIRYWLTPSGKIHVESKKELQKRSGAKSPDRADGIMLATTMGASARNGEHDATTDFTPVRRGVAITQRDIAMGR